MGSLSSGRYLSSACSSIGTDRWPSFKAAAAAHPSHNHALTEVMKSGCVRDPASVRIEALAPKLPQDAFHELG